MNKYKNITIESLCELIKFLNNDKQIAEIINDNNEIRGINNLTDALLDIDLLYTIYTVAEDEYLFDVETIKEKLEIALADAINKENIEEVKLLISELEQLLFMHYEYFLFIYLGYLSDINDIDMRDYTSSILAYYQQKLETKDIINKDTSLANEIMYKEILNIELNENDEDYDFKKVCYESSLIVLANYLCIINQINLEYSEINFVTNDYPEE